MADTKAITMENGKASNTGCMPHTWHKAVQDRKESSYIVDKRRRLYTRLDACL